MDTREAISDIRCGKNIKQHFVDAVARWTMSNDASAVEVVVECLLGSREDTPSLDVMFATVVRAMNPQTVLDLARHLCTLPWEEVRLWHHAYHKVLDELAEIVIRYLYPEGSLDQESEYWLSMPATDLFRFSLEDALDPYCSDPSSLTLGLLREGIKSALDKHVGVEVLEASDREASDQE